MTRESVRNFCLKLPHATEQVQWEDHLLFKIAGKMFAILPLEGPAWLTFKCTPEDFAELTERQNVVPSPYLARANWVRLERLDALPPAELFAKLRVSYELVRAKLPAKSRRALESETARRSRS